MKEHISSLNEQQTTDLFDLLNKISTSYEIQAVDNFLKTKNVAIHTKQVMQDMGGLKGILKISGLGEEMQQELLSGFEDQANESSVYADTVALKMAVYSFLNPPSKDQEFEEYVHQMCSHIGLSYEETEAYLEGAREREELTNFIRKERSKEKGSKDNKAGKLNDFLGFENPDSAQN